jgi:hypothetical protein
MITNLKEYYSNAFRELPSKEDRRKECETLPQVTEETLDPSKQLGFKGYQERMMDLVDWAIYDKLTITTNFNGATLFQNPIDVSRGFDETNMYMVGCLPMPQQFLLERVYFLFDPDNIEEDNKQFRRLISWDFIIGQKIYIEKSMIESNTSGRYLDTLGGNIYPKGLVPVDTLVLHDEFKLAILSQQFFKLRFHSKEVFRPTGRFSVWAFLDGILARGIQ